MWEFSLDFIKHFRSDFNSALVHIYFFLSCVVFLASALDLSLKYLNAFILLWLVKLWLIKLLNIAVKRCDWFLKFLNIVIKRCGWFLEFPSVVKIPKHSHKTPWLVFNIPKYSHKRCDWFLKFLNMVIKRCDWFLLQWLLLERLFLRWLLLL